MCSMHECIILLLLLVSTHTRPQTYNISILIFYVFALVFLLVIIPALCASVLSAAPGAAPLAQFHRRWHFVAGLWNFRTQVNQSASLGVGSRIAPQQPQESGGQCVVCEAYYWLGMCVGEVSCFGLWCLVFQLHNGVRLSIWWMRDAMVM